MGFFDKARPSSFNYKAPTSPYKSNPKPLRRKTTELFNREDLPPTRGLGLKSNKKFGGGSNIGAHPNLKSHWARNGLNPRGGSAWEGPFSKGPAPTQPCHTLKEFIFDLISLVETWGGTLLKMLNGAANKWMSGYEAVELVGRFLAMPIQVFSATC
jgi:hypothetical protein